tara:strand:- start:24 stop:302 length:279 start_codon:yes stop_codon:yes gene_type:complete
LLLQQVVVMVPLTVEVFLLVMVVLVAVLLSQILLVAPLWYHLMGFLQQHKVLLVVPMVDLEAADLPTHTLVLVAAALALLVQMFLVHNHQQV